MRRTIAVTWPLIVHWEHVGKLNKIFASLDLCKVESVFSYSFFLLMYRVLWSSKRPMYMVHKEKKAV